MSVSSVEEMETIATRAAIIAVVVIDDALDAVPTAQALLDGGINAIELALRTDASYDAIEAIRGECPEMTVGVGTVIAPEQVRRIAELGVAFAVAPGCNPRVVEAANLAGLPFAPGVATPTDMEVGLSLGLGVLKLFPAEPLGGLRYLESAASPYRHTGVKFIPLGGVEPENAADYLRSPLVCGVGGSWIAKRDAIRAGDWKAIREKATAARRIVDTL